MHGGILCYRISYGAHHQGKLSHRMPVVARFGIALLLKSHRCDLVLQCIPSVRLEADVTLEHDSTVSRLPSVDELLQQLTSFSKERALVCEILPLTHSAK